MSSYFTRKGLYTRQMKYWRQITYLNRCAINTHWRRAWVYQVTHVFDGRLWFNLFRRTRLALAGSHDAEIWFLARRKIRTKNDNKKTPTTLDQSLRETKNVQFWLPIQIKVWRCCFCFLDTASLLFYHVIFNNHTKGKVKQLVRATHKISKN